MYREYHIVCRPYDTEVVEAILCQTEQDKLLSSQCYRAANINQVKLNLVLRPVVGIKYITLSNGTSS